MSNYIDIALPVPANVGRPIGGTRYPVNDLIAGGPARVFQVEPNEKSLNNIRQAVQRARAHMPEGTKFTVRIVEQGVAVWRLA